jgi:hypothetical protein
MKFLRFLAVFFMIISFSTCPMNTDKAKKSRGFVAAINCLFSRTRQQRLEAFAITLEDEQARREGYQKINTK